MATIRHEVTIAAAAATVWDAVRDVGALHSRLVPGFVIDTRMEDGAMPPVRVVRFASGMQLRETIVACDDAERRLVWTIDDATVVHHNGALQVFAVGDASCRAVWTADVLPDDLVVPFGTAMSAGLAVMAETLASR